MAELAPFKGVMYNTEKIQELADVVTPPYDVISKKEQENFYKTHPNNMVRLILGKPEEKDTPQNTPHTRAAQYFSQWITQGILIRDEEPAFYLKSIQFEWDGVTYTRYGIIALVRIEAFDKGVILPHEKTFSRVKSERLELLKACNTNFDPVFALYPDNEDVFSQLTQKIQDKPSDIAFTDNFQQHHQLWRITDPNTHHLITTSLAPESLVIADGHHRYETALNYRNWLKEKSEEFSPDHPANFVMMYLSSMKDPGLIVLPAHRLVNDIDQTMMDNIFKKGRDFFEFEVFPYDSATREKVQTEFISQLQAHKSQNAVGFLHKRKSAFHLLLLKPDAMDRLFGNEIPSTLKNLDVTVLTRLIFMELLGFDQKRLDNEQLIGYNSKANKAIESVMSGEYDAAFILNSTPIEQVRSVALNRLTMPRKSTYFYPKVVAGIVQNTLTP